MPLPPLPGAPIDQVDAVFRALCAVLQTDPDLAAVTRTWRLWTGDPDDAQPPATGEMPWLRLTPMASPMKLAEEAAWDMNLKVKYELATQGTNFSDLANYFGVFRRALNFEKRVQDTTALEFIRQSGAVTYQFESAAIGQIRQPIFDPLATGAPVIDLLSAGVLSLYLLIPT